jgi:hypothetical protein
MTAPVPPVPNSSGGPRPRPPAGQVALREAGVPASVLKRAGLL